MIKKLLVHLEKHIKEKFPKYNAKFYSEHLETKFSRVYPPKLIFSTMWKHDYIISKKN